MIEKKAEIITWNKTKYLTPKLQQMNHRVLGVENSATRFFLTAGVSGLADAGEIRYASLSCARVDCAQRAKVN
jgi:hypothetical protein